MRNSLLPLAFIYGGVSVLPTVLAYFLVGHDVAVKVGFGTYLLILLVLGYFATKDI